MDVNDLQKQLAEILGAPCPWCGRGVVLYQKLTKDRRWIWLVECQTCRARVRGCTLVLAIDYWREMLEAMRESGRETDSSDVCVVCGCDKDDRGGLYCQECDV